MGRPAAAIRDGSFGRYLRRQRGRRHLTLETVEALSSNFGERLSKTYLSRLENSRTSPNLTTLGTLALLYDVPLSEMVERYEIDRRLRLVEVRIEANSPAQIVEEATRKVKAGIYLEALALSRRVRERMESVSRPLPSSAHLPGYHRLQLIEAECLLHLGFHESAKVDAERILRAEDLSLEDRLVAWHCIVACCIWLERFHMAEATLAHAECLLQLPEAPARFRADFAFLHGNMSFKSGHYEAALEAYWRALKIFASLPKPLEVCRCRVLIGAALVELGKRRSARMQLEKALAMAERSGQAA